MSGPYSAKCYVPRIKATMTLLKDNNKIQLILVSNQTNFSPPPGLPNELSIFWHQYPDMFGDCFCRLRSFLSEAASYASVLTILAFSLERYLAICRPLYVFPLGDLRRAALVSSACWSVALAASVPHALYTKINYLPFPYPAGPPAPESAFCAMLDIPAGYPVHQLSFLVFFLVPILLLTYLYVAMVGMVRRATKASIR